MKTENIDNADMVTITMLMWMFRNRFYPSYGLNRATMKEMLKGVPSINAGHGVVYYNKKAAMAAIEERLK